MYAKSENNFHRENEKLLYNYEIIIACSEARAFITASHFLPQRCSDFTLLDKNLSTVGLMMSSRICNIVAHSRPLASHHCARDVLSIRLVFFVLPLAAFSRFSFNARDCNGYDFSFLTTITYARKRIYGIKCKHPSSVTSKIQDDEQICRRFSTEKEREREFALTNEVAVCFGQRTNIRRKRR